MANWSNPTLTSLYTDFVTEVKNRDVDLALGLDPATTSPTNVPTNAIRWNSASFKYQKWNGSTWNDLSTKYIFTAVEVSGATVPVNGMYLSTTNTLNFSTASTASRLTIDGSGNVNIDNGTFYVDAVNNRVGIGTTGPVVGTLIDAYQALYPLINTRCNGNGAAGYGSSTDNQTNLWFFGARKDSIGGAIGTDRFNLLYNNNTFLTVDTSGNFGLGNAAQPFLSLRSTTNASSGTILSAIDSYSTPYSLTNARIAFRGGYVGYSDLGAMSFQTKGFDGLLDRMFIASDGKVGIGTTSPSTILEASQTTGTRIRSSYTNSGGGRDAGFEIYGDIAGSFAVRSSLIYAGNTGITSLTSSQDLALSTGGSERCRIDSSGRLLVGASSTSDSAKFLMQGNAVDSGGGAIINLCNGKATPVNGEATGIIRFSDNTHAEAVTIVAARDGGTWSASSKPTRLVFSTTADGAATPTPRMQINNLGYMQGTVNGLGAGRIPAKQYYRLNSSYTGTDGTAAQAIYGVGVTLISSTVYEFEAIYALARNSGTTSHTMSFLFGGTATVNNIFYTGVGPGYSTSIPPLTTFYNYAASFVSTSASAAVASPSMTLSGAIFYIVKGTVSINSGGTFIPQYQLSAAPGGAYSTYAGAYFSIWPLAASGSAVNIGSWA